MPGRGERVSPAQRDRRDARIEEDDRAWSDNRLGLALATRRPEQFEARITAIIMRPDQARGPELPATDAPG